MVSPAVFDTLAALALLVIAIAGAYAPVLLSRLGKDGAASSRSLAFVLGNMLSAGVMIAAGFVHLLGSAQDALRGVSRFPLAPCLCGAGFILTLIADFVGQRLASRSQMGLVHCHSLPPLPAERTEAGAEGPAAAELREVVVPDAPEAPRGNGAPAGGAPGDTASAGMRAQHSFELEPGPQPNGNGPAAPASASRQGTPRAAEGAAEGVAEGEKKAQAVHRGASLDREPLFGPGQELSTGGTGGGAAAAALAPPVAVQIHPSVSFITAALMGMALCFHSILEGMAMGAQATIVDSLHVFIAIFAHKGLAAYALGSSIVDSGASRRRFWTVIAAFALATPLGILLGRVVAGESDGAVAAGLSAVASGTFLYVAFMEVIPKELRDPRHGFYKLGMLCLGFSAMSVLAIWA